MKKPALRPLFFCVLFACGALGPDEPPGVLQQPGRDLQGRDLQGRDLQGPSFRRHEARLSTLSRPPIAFLSVTLDRARIKAVQADGTDDPRIVAGATMTRGDGGQLRILRAQQHADRSGVLQPDQYEYEIEYLTGTMWQPLCPGEPRGNWAVPGDGIWGTDGYHVFGGGDRITFACLESVITKCLDWKYQPWLPSPRAADAPKTLADYHQACTRMARADYCGDGKTYTINGTEINMYDRMYVLSHPGQRQAPQPPSWPFEGVWASGKGRGALCLSKLRWQTLAPRGPCPVELPDPRDPANKGNPRAIYCEQSSTREWAAAGGLMFNESAFIDRGLYTWFGRTDGGGNDYLTTSTLGDYDPAHGGTAPRPGYVFFRFEGAVLTRPAMGRIALYRWRSPAGEYRTTTIANGLPGVRQALEGYVYTTREPGRVLLRLYRSGADYLTTTGAPPPGYVFVQNEGYLPR